MGLEAIKLELIEWLTRLDDIETIEYLKIVKDAKSSSTDWWTELSDSQLKGIKQGLEDIEKGRLTDHADVKKKYDF